MSFLHDLLPATPRIDINTSNIDTDIFMASNRKFIGDYNYFFEKTDFAISIDKKS